MRKLKVFGIAITAMFAISAIAAASAFASYDSEVSPVSLSGTSTNSQVFNTEFGEVVCSSGTFSGTQSGTEIEGGGGFESATVTVHPSYTGCEALGFGASVTTTGCNYEFTSAKHANIVCSSGNAIQVVAAGGLCSVEVPAQTDVGAVEFTNSGSGSTRTVTVNSKANEIEYKGVGGFCSGEGEELGSYTGKVHVEGSSGGVQKGIWVE